jgi:hypothetical protein
VVPVAAAPIGREIELAEASIGAHVEGKHRAPTSSAPSAIASAPQVAVCTDNCNDSVAVVDASAFTILPLAGDEQVQLAAHERQVAGRDL